ncbi:MAG: hypothetical protein NXH94_20785 [Rhodobacteraceae bacterium]|nr:hypothetical protein [Paracoccaceae bacterium]
MEQGLRVLLDRATYLKGQEAKVAVEAEGVEDFEHLQIEVFHVGVDNPSSQLGLGKAASTSQDGVYRTGFSTTSFPFGFYEIKLVRFHTVKGGSEGPPVDFLAGTDFERTFFEIVPPFALPKSKEAVAISVGTLENSIETAFLRPRYANGLPREAAKQFAVFVFVRNLMIGRRYRLDRFELVPSPVGVSNENETSSVNAFLEQLTSTGLSFANASNEPTQSQTDNPVCVAYFPTVIANSQEDARAYCASLTDTALLSLGLMRGSSGRIFATVVVPQAGDDATLFSTHSSYGGNLLTGGLAGEKPEVLQQYQEQIETDPKARLWADLYRAAQSEEDPEFKYFKYWQVLEVVAEDLGDSEGDEYIDEEGDPIADARELKETGSSVKRVFRLLRLLRYGSAKAAWENANKWFALRTAVGHKGVTSQFGHLQRETVRDWASKALVENADAGFPKVLNELKGATEHVLRCKVSTGD